MYVFLCTHLIFVYTLIGVLWKRMRVKVTLLSIFVFINLSIAIVLTICYQTEISISSVYYSRILKGYKDNKKNNAILHSRSWCWQSTTEGSIYVFFASCKVYPKSIEKNPCVHSGLKNINILLNRGIQYVTVWLTEREIHSG